MKWCLAVLVVLLAERSLAMSFGDALEGRIINGELASTLGSEHLVSIRLKKEDWFFGAGHRCGGALITPNIVLTAAHCIVSNFTTNEYYDASELTVAMGSLDRFDYKTATSVAVASYKVHEKFDFLTLVNDVALLYLNGTVPDVKNIKPITLASKPIKEGTNCGVSGWGVTENKTMTQFLMSAEVLLNSAEQCALTYGEFLPKGVICAGGKDRGSCNADSGGPLVCNGQLTGVVSFGSVGCNVTVPGAYSDVAYHYEWIRANGSEGLHVSFGLLLIAFLVKNLF